MSKSIYITNTSLDGYRVTTDLELLETRRFGTSVIHVRYRIRGGAP
jgi:hypothetical protein